ncbi:hypothetical protein [Cohnella soli]|uniref:Uncharacterized protein n=1 Tax=Cohnella soli TaxID=425005 RepID=A0ABW0HPF4_9BACL
MGLESFYISVVPANDLDKRQIELKLQNHGYKLKVTSENEYYINDFIILNIFCEHDVIKKISFEGCFSWYRECIKEIYDVNNFINVNLEKLTIIWPEPIEEFLENEHEFFEKVNFYYSSKYNQYVTTFKLINKKLLPRENFYHHIKKKNLLRSISSLFKK